MRYFTLLVLSFLATYVIGQNTYTVSNGGDSGPGSLRQAIVDANTHVGEDFIVFSSNFQVTLTTAELTISDPVTITGNGAAATIIDGGSNFRVFTVTSMTSAALPRFATFKNMTIQNGKSPINTGGGAVSTSAVNLTFNNVNFLNNIAVNDIALGRVDGGAISISSSGLLTVDACTFDGNKVFRGTAPSDGGAFGGAIAILGGVTADIKNSTFTNNISEGGMTNNPSTTASGGGAIYSSGTICTITDCSFSNNKASYVNASATYDLNGLGGAIMSFSPLTLKGSLVFQNNISGGSGGAIYKNNSGGFNVTAVTSLVITGNRGAVSNIVGGGNGGGGIFTAAVLSLTAANNVTINDNATFGHGGGIFSTASLTLNNIASITNNSAIFGGGAIYATGALTLTDMTISGNKAGYNPDTKTYTVPAGGYGGGGLSAGGALTLAGNIVFQRDTVAGYGGAFYKTSTAVFDDSQLKSLTISDNATVSGNSSNTHGGGIYTRGNISITNANNVVISNNSSTSNGGGIYVVSGLTVSLKNALITGNSNSGIGSGTAGGGGVYTQAPAGALVLENSTVSNNKAGYSTTSGSFGTVGVGGGINALGLLTLNGNVVIQDNLSAVSGGGIYKGGKSTLTTSGLTSFTVTRNKAYGRNTNTGKGGGIYTEYPLTLTNANGVSITDNLALGDGGGIYASVDSGYINVTLDNISPITNNAATTSGGAIYASGSLLLNNMTISNNRAGYNSETKFYTNRSGGGGGVYAADALTLTGNIVFQNDTISGNGGAIYKAATGGFSTTGLTSFLMSRNKAQSSAVNVAFGGGIYTLAPLSLSAINGTMLNNNGADLDGGAIYANDSLSLKYVTLLNNTSFRSGGAVYLGSAAKMASIANTYANNSCLSGGGNGGAISLATTATATILNNTFSSNSSMKGDGGAIYMPGAAGSLLRIAFSTFNGNFNPGGNGQAIFMGTQGTQILNGNIIYGNGSGAPEIVFGGALNASYNIVRGVSVLPIVTGNANIIAGQASQIFSAIGSGDLATLANNGGPTQTFRIRKNGFAYNRIPVSTVSSWISDFGTISNDQRDSLRLQGCKYDVGSVEIIGPDDVVSSLFKNQTLCPNSQVDADTLILSTVNVVDTLYYQDAGYTQLFPMPATISSATNIYVKFISTSNCEALDVMQVGVFPKESTWINSAANADWNNQSNWDNGIPGPCTNVIIPESKTAYPILQVADVNYTQAACDTITFKFGGEVAKTNYLSYNFANVDLTLEPNRWYMPAPTLQQQYSGDYLESGSQFRINPEIFIMYYQTGNPETGAAKVESKFTGFFKNTDELLKIATGHAIWVDKGARGESNFTLHFPKDSTQYAYYQVGTNMVTRFSGIMQRDKRGRFIYEGNASYISNGNGSFSQTIENSNSYRQVIIGNPYMSHLDVVEFQRQNDSYLDKTFYIWKDGTSYEAYVINGDGTITGTGGPNNIKIAPMQSFIFSTRQLFTAPLLFTPNMSITDPGSTLRSAINSPDQASSYSPASNVLKVEIVRNGSRQSGIAVRYLSGASRHYSKDKDAWTIFPKNVKNYVSLYALVDGGAASIHTTGDITIPVDLGISVGSDIKKAISNGIRELYSIQLAEGVSAFSGQEVYLYDALNKYTHNLTQSAYTFENLTGDITGRFQLFATTNPTGIGEVTSEKQIRITTDNQRINIESTPGEPIREIKVFNTVGRLLYTTSNINVSDWSFLLEQRNQTVIIKVETKNSSLTEKIFLK